jgi:hypothetical protein
VNIADVDYGILKNAEQCCFCEHSRLKVGARNAAVHPTHASLVAPHGPGNITRYTQKTPTSVPGGQRCSAITTDQSLELP